MAEPPVLDSNQAFKRARNRGLILDTLRQGDVSRLGLHKQTGIRLSTVGDLVDEMLRAQLLVERGTAPKIDGERGRPESLLTLNLEGPFAIGVYLDREVLRAGLVNLSGTPLKTLEAKLPPNVSAPKLLDIVVSETKALLLQGAPEGPCLGMGVNLPGILAPEEGRVVLSAAFPGLEKAEALTKRLGAALEIDNVMLGNVANGYLRAERLYGAVRGERDVLLVLLEPGQIGAALLCDGRPVRGALESSAELGHVKIEDGGPACACGGKGCLETFIGWKYLRTRLIDKGRSDLAEAGLEEFWPSTRATYAELRAEALRRIGRAVASVANLVRPRVILLAGSLAKHQETVCAPLEAAIRRETLRPFAEQLEVRTSALGPAAGILGGAALVLEQVFAIPELSSV